MIKWKGYSAEESTWEPEKHLNCPAIIAKYKSKIAAESSKRRNDTTDESDSDENIKHSINKKKTIKKKTKSNIIISSPSSSGSQSPTRFFFMSSPPRESNNHSVPSQGIAKFFKPTAETLPAINSDDLVQESRRIGLVNA